DPLPAEPPEVLLELVDHSALLQLVDLDHGRQQLEVVARIRSELLQGVRVFGEAAPPIADACTQKMRPQPVVETYAFGDLLDIGAGDLTDVRNLVDETDARRQERVCGELDHLGRRHVPSE